MYKTGISVIICCYNSAQRIAQTIKHIALQKIISEISWEIILVNNASTDDTIFIANEEWSKYDISNINFTIVDEDKPGLSNARKKGIEASEFEYVIFCDDDNWLDDNYLQTAYQIMSQSEKIAALGGQCTAISTVDLPDWFELSKNNYAVGKQATTSGDISYKKYLWGSGIVLRKKLYVKAFSNFSPLLIGRKGMELSSGEDAEICMRFLLMGYRIFYSDNLVFKHFISKERLTKEYNNRLLAGFIQSEYKLKLYSKSIDLLNLTFNEKFITLIKSFIKIIAINVLKIKRWDISEEKLKVYIISAYRFKTTSQELVHIRKLTTLN